MGQIFYNHEKKMDFTCAAIFDEYNGWKRFGLWTLWTVETTAIPWIYWVRCIRRNIFSTISWKILPHKFAIITKFIVLMNVTLSTVHRFIYKVKLWLILCSTSGLIVNTIIYTESPSVIEAASSKSFETSCVSFYSQIAICLAYLNLCNNA